MGNNILIVPVQVDALFVPVERMVVGETADFSKLPYTTPEVDVHPNNPYISEEIVSQPFQNTNLNLNKGIHLHWSLPDTLTRGWQDNVTKKTKFPIVPNRWLIRRKRKVKQRTEITEWVVLSDYLHPDSEGDGNVCIPCNPEDPNYRPFRFLGKTLPRQGPLEQYDPNRTYPSYSELPDCELTVLGYGEPTFAAFYPNCHSVFGFHDPVVETDQDLEAHDLTGLEYEVIGWYSDPNKDFLKLQIRKIKKEQVNPSEADIWKYIAETLRWTDADPATPEIHTDRAPREMVCYSQIKFEVDATKALGQYKSEIQDVEATVAVGMTGTEALSAYLGHTLAKKLNADDTRKRKIEEQMEALLMGTPDGTQVDTPARFKRFRHEKGFLAEEAGSSWFIKKQGDQIINESLLDNASENSKKELAKLNAAWDLIRDKLGNLNKQQLEYDTAIFEVEARKEQLFADWYKYMVCAYPPESAWDSVLDIDDVKYFIVEQSLRRLGERMMEVGTLTIMRRPKIEASWSSELAGELAEAINKMDQMDHTATEQALAASASSTLAGELADAINEMVTMVSDHNAALSDFVANTAPEKEVVAPTFTLAQKARPRFWKPRNPVILAVGPALEPSQRYGRDGANAPTGRLACATTDGYDTALKLVEANDPDTFSAKRDRIPSAFHTWKDQPWNPLTLEWKVQLFPVSNKGNARQDALDFEPGFIAQNFELPENEADVRFKELGGQFTPSASIYSGSSILTPHANKQMLEALEAYIEKNVLDKYRAPATTTAATDFDLNSEIGSVIEGYENPTLEDLNYMALQAYRTATHLPSLSQALGGMNASLLMRKETLQLKIKDPLAFPEYGAFTTAVAVAVGGASRSAPLPQNDFNPLRAGKLLITDLRIVDSFGQYINLDISNLITSEYLESPDSDSEILLRPRFLQPTQVHFRWLASQAAGQESNEMRHNNPICGWVMPNNLDNSLMIFNADGTALGAFTESDNDWKPAPGTNDGVILSTDVDNWTSNEPSSINPNLYRMMFYLRERLKEDDGFLKHFREAINSALENILPDSFAQHRSMAQLVGRPIAIVRASLDLVTKAPPAIHQGWNEFQLDMNRTVRETNEFTRVKFPIRIGEYKQLNDGVVGYWVEGPGGYARNTFFSPSSDNEDFSRAGDDPSEKYIDTRGDEPVNQFQTLDDGPMKVTLLLDPRGKVNLTTGLLPVKTIDIPADLYAEAMNSIEVFFVSSPHLLNSGGLRLNLPQAPGYAWSFIGKSKIDGEWLEEIVEPGAAAETLFSGEKTIREGWLKLVKDP